MKYLRNYKNYLIITLIIILIILHGFLEKYFKVDTITVLLLLLILILPYIPNVKKIKYGEFEAEIKTEEVKAVQEKVDEVSTKSVQKEKVSNIEELLNEDPKLAIAGIRLELEKQIRNIYEIYTNVNDIDDNRNIKKIIKFLKSKEIIDNYIFDAANDLIDITNRVIKGESISNDNIVKLVDTSTTVLTELEFVVMNHILKNVKVELISEEKVNKFINSKFKLTTINTLEENPEKKTYLLNQTELEAFLENYKDFGEFVVEINRNN